MIQTLSVAFTFSDFFLLFYIIFNVCAHFHCGAYNRALENQQDVSPIFTHSRGSGYG